MVPSQPHRLNQPFLGLKYGKAEQYVGYLELKSDHLGIEMMLH